MKHHLLLLAAVCLAAASCFSEVPSKNIARHRTVTASSTYDYNLTAQLVCDGIVEKGEPARLTVTSPSGELKRLEKEFALDCGPFSSNFIKGENGFLDYRWTGLSFETPCVRVTGLAILGEGVDDAPFWSIRLLAASGSGELRCLAEEKGKGLIGKANGVKSVSDPNKSDSIIKGKARKFLLEIPVDSGSFDHFRAEFSMPGATAWKITAVEFSGPEGFKPDTGNGKYRSEKARGINVLPSQVFSSAWMSLDGEPQWLKIDLGRVSSVSSLDFHWIHPCRSGSVEISGDGASWRKIADIPSGGELEYNVPARGRGRYVRINMEGADESGRFCLSEVEVNGNSDAEVQKSDWRLERASEVHEDGEVISSAAYDDSSWLPAVVPGTVLWSHIAAGAVPDPNISDNNQQISESYFYSDFWYRGTVRASAPAKGGRSLLEFDGINFKAEVFFNGKRLGDIAGAFRQKAFDVTGLLSDENVVAVHIIKGGNFGATKEKCAERPGFNGGLSGADSPSFQASIGWDWIPTVRGREIGIWNDVRIRSAKCCDVSHPLVLSHLSADGMADITAGADLANLTDAPVSGTLKGAIADICFEKPVTLAAGESATVTFSPEEFPQLKGREIGLWWPNGMGEARLHKAWFRFEPEGAAASEAHDIDYLAGIREFTYEDTMSDLKMYVNGHRFIPKGGNWGFSEANLRYRAAEYDKAVSMHKEMNFNMIRDWVGQIGDEEFYEACDKYGIVVWQDFWLANPCDGPDPDDEDLFMDNADNYLRRIRSHACIGLYCARNEGYPSQTLNPALKKAVNALHPGIVYIPNSADDGVSGHGPYRAVNPDDYFAMPALKFHTERGMPAILNIGSLKKIFGEDHLWPGNDVWGQHDFTRTGAQGDTAFVNMVRKGFGEKALESAESFSRYAQWINYDGYRAMFETNNVKRKGLLIWMSHSCWPSLAWQTYDYWFDRNGAFWGSQKACEPLHVQFHPLSRTIQVVNTSAADAEGLSVSVTLKDKNGKEIWSRSASGISAAEDSTVDAIVCDALPDGPCVMTLNLSGGDGKAISRNVYLKNFLNGVNTGDYSGLGDATIKKVLLSLSNN